MENSGKEFRKLENEYIHYASQKFDTGLEINLLQNYCFISLDNYFQLHHNIIESKLDAWLHFLGSEDIVDIYNVIEAYPEFEELYKRLFEMRKNPEEVTGMYSEALRIMDRNTVKYMVEEQQSEIEEDKKIMREQQNKLEEQQREIDELKRQLAEALDNK